MSINRKATSIRLSDEEMELLDRVAAERNISKTAAIVAGLRALDAREPLSQDAVVDWIKRNTRPDGK